MIFTNEAPSIDLSIAERLRALRQEMEGDGSIAEVEVPAVLLLDDVCSALELPQTERVWVLGDGGMAFVESVKETTVAPVGIKNGRPLIVSWKPSVR